MGFVVILTTKLNLYSYNQILVVIANNTKQKAKLLIPYIRRIERLSLLFSLCIESTDTLSSIKRSNGFLALWDIE